MHTGCCPSFSPPPWKPPPFFFLLLSRKIKRPGSIGKRLCTILTCLLLWLTNLLHVCDFLSPCSGCNDLSLLLYCPICRLRFPSHAPLARHNQTRGSEKHFSGNWARSPRRTIVSGSTGPSSRGTRHRLPSTSSRWARSAWRNGARCGLKQMGSSGYRPWVSENKTDPLRPGSSSKPFRLPPSPRHKPLGPLPRRVLDLAQKCE